MATRVRKGKQATTTTIIKKALPVTDGLNSEETARQYRFHFDKFLKWMDVAGGQDALLNLDRDTFELEVIKYLKHLRYDRDLKRSSINLTLASIMHFCKVNAIWLHKERLSQFLPEDKNYYEDREYRRDEIELLLKESDVRLRAVFLILASAGLRIGAIPELEIRDLIAWPLPTEDPKPQKVYQIWVYNRSRRHRYYTFVTPECTDAIDEYLAFRKDKAKEDITKGTSPLIREQFPLFNKRIDASIPKRVTKSSLQHIISSIVIKAGLDTTADQRMLTHAFRKFCYTQMIAARLNTDFIEYLIGHKLSRGLKKTYDKTSVEDRLVEWSKAINYLTIETDSFHLQKELKVYRDEYAKKLNQQAKTIELLQAELQKKSETSSDKISDIEAQLKYLNQKLKSIKRIDDDKGNMHHYEIEAEPLTKKNK